MADLIAQGPRLSDRWRRPLPLGKPVTVGRAGPGWSTPWDEKISRQHVEVEWQNENLRVRQLPAAKNAVFFKGAPVSECDVAPGEHFVIGLTTFTVTAERVQVSLDMPNPVQEQAFSPQYLDRVQFRHAEAQIEVLGRLPDVISSSTNDAELYGRVVNLLMSGVPRAAAAALIAVPDGPSSTEQPVHVLHWDRRMVTGDDFQPSERLIREAVSKRESLLHIWKGADEAATFTLQQGIDWAFCTPVLGDACRGWAIYVAGRFQVDPSSAGDVSDPSDLRDDLKFTELAAKTLAALRYSRLLERQRSSLSQFFSPIVLEAIANADPDLVLAPREANVTVIFCDLRGFSRHSERSSDDLYGLLNRVSAALGVTTHAIRERGGVLGDFHGDAAMGFWGWPLEQPDGTLRACQTALEIRREFAAAAARGDTLIADFSQGIGIATGRAVAGKIGTTDQVKVTVFGPVVNLASRLEGMSKMLDGAILLDQSTAEILRRQSAQTPLRLRTVGKVRPYGMERSVVVTELLPLADDAAKNADTLERYQLALQEFQVGRWEAATKNLSEIAAHDGVARFLNRYIEGHGAKPPAEWDGVIPLETKSL